MRHELFPEDHLQPGEHTTWAIGDISIVVIRKPDGEYRALRNRCSHSGAPLSRGWMMPMVVGNAAGDMSYSSDYVLICPWHGYEFKVDDGRCPADPKHARVKSYNVYVENEVVVLER